VTQGPEHFFRYHLGEVLEYRTVDCMLAYKNLLKLQKALFGPTKAIQLLLLRPFERDSPTGIAKGFVCCISEDLANDPAQCYARLAFAN
jgi:hypothetical protein